MKKKSKLLSFLLIIALTSTYVSCTNEEFSEQDETLQEANHLPKDVLSKTYELQLNPSDIIYKEVTLPDGSSQEFVIVSEDMAMEKERFLNIPSDENGIAKQYRTEFIIDTDAFKTINVYAFIGDEPPGFAISENVQQAVRDAVENWNAVNSSIKLELDFGTAPEVSADFYETVIIADPALDFALGIGDFPDETGAPGDFIILNPLLNTATNSEALEHILTHEFGHTLGFRHSDWDTRISCVLVGADPEPVREAPDASLIFGTLPSIAYQEDSIMNACFDGREVNGEINFFDGVGLLSLYPPSASN